MPNTARRAAEFPFFLVLAKLTLVTACLFLSACARQNDSVTWSSPEGIALEWTPAEPRFGDLVHVEARYPSIKPIRFVIDEKDINGLFNPQGKRVPINALRFSGDQALIVWQFRVTSCGDWTWGKDTKILWTTKTEADSATELKTLDAQGLWEGTLKKAPQSKDAPSQTPELDAQEESTAGGRT